jgi:anionic cell wall polymer biosynthesis LytR-Cps2A-Psr (LCP) family protein
MTTYADPAARSPRPRRPADEPPRAKSSRKSKPRKPKIAPLWAKLSVILGSIVMVASGLTVVVPKVLAAWAFHDIVQPPILDAPPKTIDGPINILLLGMDQRDGAEAEGAIRADSIIIVHIPATHDRAFLISLPRDAEVAIPAFPETHFAGMSAAKINAAFAMGATKNGAPDSSPEGRARGAKLTAMTIDKLVPGGLPFNSVAILNYDGFLSILKVLGGVDMCVDEEVYSIHYDRNGKKVYPDLPDGVGKHYPVGCYHMQDWEALDFARQRHLPDGDYGRQRHQQQLIKAIIKKATSMGVLTDVSKLLALQKAAGDLLTLDLGGVPPEEWVFTLKSLGSNDLVMIKTNGGKFTSAGNGNERFSEDSLSLLQALSTDTVMDFLVGHPDWVASDQ